MSSLVICDTDFISSFLWINEENLLIDIINSNIRLPRQVYNELCKLNHFKIKIDILINDNKLKVEDIEVGTVEETLYLEMVGITNNLNTRIIGRGEAASISIAKERNGILASNNLKDIVYYIKKYNLKYITTADIIDKAYKEAVISLNKAETMWTDMLNKRRKLPFDTFKEYLDNKKS